MDEVITLRWNNGGVNDLCPMCSTQTVLPIGPALFFQNTGRPACDTCSEREAPEVVALRNVWYVLDTEAKRLDPAAAARFSADVQAAFRALRPEPGARRWRLGPMVEELCAGFERSHPAQKPVP